MVVSSVAAVAAVVLNPNRPKGQALDEECWSAFLKLFPELLSPGENNSGDSSFGVC